MDNDVIIQQVEQYIGQQHLTIVATQVFRMQSLERWAAGLATDGECFGILGIRSCIAVAVGLARAESRK